MHWWLRWPTSTIHKTKFSYTKQNSQNEILIHKTKFQYTKQNSQNKIHKTKFTIHKTKFTYSYIIPIFQYTPYIKINFKYFYARKLTNFCKSVVGYYVPVSSEKEFVHKNDVENVRWPVRDTFVPQNIRAFIETVNYSIPYKQLVLPWR